MMKKREIERKREKEPTIMNATLLKLKRERCKIQKQLK